MTHWTDRPLSLTHWKRVPGNPFADYDPDDGVAVWSLWAMPPGMIGERVIRKVGRPRGEPTAVRSIRAPVAHWDLLEQRAANENTTVNAIIATLIADSATLNDTQDPAPSEPPSSSIRKES